MKQLAVALMAVFLIGSIAVSAEKTEIVKLSVTGMTCGSCVQKLEKALKGVTGVTKVKVSLETKTADITVSSDAKVAPEKLVNVIAEAGYKASPYDAQKEKSIGKKVKSGGCEEECPAKSAGCGEKKAY